MGMEFDVLENQSAPTTAVSVAVSALNASASEGDDVVFTVNLSQAASDRIKLRWNKKLIKGKETSIDDLPRPQHGWITFTPGETSFTFRVRTTKDSKWEDDERFKVTLIPSAKYFSQYAVLEASEVYGTIVNDD